MSSCCCHRELEGGCRTVSDHYIRLIFGYLPLALNYPIPVPSNRRKVLAETVSALQLQLVCSVQPQFVFVAHSGYLFCSTLAGLLARTGF